MSQVNAVVFSKDRACQLHAFLSSYRRHVPTPPPMQVLLKASNPRFAAGYARLQSLTPWATFVPQRVWFKYSLLRLIDPGRKYTVFFVDDIVFRRDFSFDDPRLACLDEPDVCCLSLRLSPRINYTYSQNVPSPPPVTAGGKWTWAGQPGDWGYPMSLDGHIFLTSQILPHLQRTRFTNPNDLEAALAASPLPRPTMVCLDEHPLFNIPVNRVQSTYPNRHADGWTAEQLNERFLEGQAIDTVALDAVENNSVHFEVAYRFQTLDKQSDHFSTIEGPRR